jgi:hypothetical protein
VVFVCVDEVLVVGDRERPFESVHCVFGRDVGA